MTAAARGSGRETEAAGAKETNSSEARSLDVQEIIDAGLKLGISQGFENLSIRALARELGVSPMATYHHVGKKNDLLALIIDAVLSRIEVPDTDFGSWDERLRELNARNTAALDAYPGVDRVIFDMRPTPEGWRLINAYIEILLDAGFSERQAALGFSAIHSYGMGRAGMERALQRSARDRTAPPSSWSALERVNGYWSELHRPDHRDFAIEVILTGLRTLLEQMPEEGQ